MDKLKATEHKFKDAVFGLSRSFLNRSGRELKPLDGKSLSRVLFLRPEKIGDLVVSLPVFDGLKQAFPHIEISLLASPRNIELVATDPRFAHLYLYRKNILKDIAAIRQIRKERFDCVVDMICDDSVTALYLSQLCAPGKPRIGVGKRKFREYYDFNYDHRMGNSGHMIDNTLKLLEAFGIDSSRVSGYAQPYVNAAAFARADQYLKQLPPVTGSGLRIGYNISTGHASRIWAAEKSEALLKRIQEMHPGTQIITISVGPDRDRGEALAKKVGANIFQVPAGLSLMEVSALLSRLDVLISPDTSLVHIARTFKVPVVGMYCRFQWNYLLWSPYGQPEGAVISGHDGNIFDITVDQMLDAFEKTLALRKQAV
jgi:ADP-heptose:LPS heptosyltransferase